MGVEAILLRYLVVISGVELFAEKSANKTNADGLSVRQGYDKNLIQRVVRVEEALLQSQTMALVKLSEVR
jgi:hypothetical protein